MPATLEAPAPELRTLTLGQLARAYRAGEVTFDAARAECDRRDAAERRAATIRARQSEWFDAAHAQYLAAEQATGGYLLSRAGLAASIDPITLWRASERDAARWSSEELRAHWADHPRVTPAQYAHEMAASRRDEREQAAAERAAERETVRIVAAPAPKLQPARVCPVTRPALEVPRATAPGLVAVARPVIPPMTPGAIARYTNALTNYAQYADTLTARLLAAHDSIRRAS